MKLLIKSLLILIGLALVAGGGLFFWQVTTGQRTIQELLTENTELKQSISHLSSEQQIGYAKVLKQEIRKGKLFTQVLFVQTAMDDPAEAVMKKEYEIEGDVVHFDGLIIRFHNQLVQDGKEKAIFLWRRVYGEKMLPEDGFPIETTGTEPARYAVLCQTLSIQDRQLFWNEIWNLANEPKKLENLGISSIFGNVVYRTLKPGLIYVFKLSSTGSIYPEVIPDL